MSNPNVRIFSPDKLTKDLQWDSLLKASRFAHGRLLDIGCGNMPYKSIFDHKVNEYVGLDIHNPLADIRADFLKARIPKSSYDTVLCTQVLEHIYDPNRCMSKIHSVLKKGGVVILTAPFMGSLHETPHDYYRFTKYSLDYLFKKFGFRIMYIHEQGNWISALGQEGIFYLESTCNRHLLKYPKRLLQVCIQLTIRMLARLPKRFTKPDRCPINYIVLAQKI
jgi:SAM-dependent methyltransferase